MGGVHRLEPGECDSTRYRYGGESPFLFDPFQVRKPTNEAPIQGPVCLPTLQNLVDRVEKFFIVIPHAPGQVLPVQEFPKDLKGGLVL